MIGKTERVYKPASPKREPSDKQVFKRKAKNFVEGLARSVFHSSFKSAQIKSRGRREEIEFKLLVLGHNTLDRLTLLNSEISTKIGSRYTLEFNGKINARNSREELHIYLTVFDNEFKQFLLDDCFNPEKDRYEQSTRPETTPRSTELYQ